MMNEETGVERRSGADHLARALAGYGVSHVFHVPTVAVPSLPLMLELGVTPITAHSEKAAAYMADGYARAVNRVGVCMAQGIGSTNLASGLREPWMRRSPVVALTGGHDPEFRYRHVYQEVDDASVIAPLVKLSAQVDRIDRLPDLLRQAFRTATVNTPGPVHLQVAGMSAQLLTREFEIDPQHSPAAEPQFAAVPPFRPVPSDELLASALQLIAMADRPVILAGGGAVISGAHSVLRKLVETLGVPVVTSLTAKGIVAEEHSLAMGCLGASSRPSANRAVSEADLVFVLASRLDSQVTNNWHHPAPGTTIIQLDINAEELGRNYPNAISLVGDVRTALSRMLAMSEPSTRHREWSDRCAGFVAEFRADKIDVLGSDEVPMRPERLCRAITSALPDDAVFVTDTGHSAIWTASMIDLKPTHTFLRAGGSLGWAVPAAMGAKCAVGDRPVVCLTGDGGLYYHLTELETAARHGINVVVIVNNNNSLGQDRNLFRQVFGGPDVRGDRLWEFREVDLADVADRFGCLGIRVERPDELDTALKQALAAGRPTLVDVVTDVTAVPDTPWGGVDFYRL